MLNSLPAKQLKTPPPALPEGEGGNSFFLSLGED